MSHPGGRPSRRAGNDAGIGVLSATFGLMFFLGFVLFATQVCVNLTAASAASDEAHRSAVAVAASTEPAQEAAAQSDRLQARFGDADPGVTIAVEVGSDTVTVTIGLHSTATLRLLAPTIERQAQVRREQVIAQ